MANDKTQLKIEEVINDNIVLTDINPRTNTKSVEDTASGTMLNESIDRIWNAINNKLSRIVNSVNGRTGVVVLTADDVGLGNVDNVSIDDIKKWVINRLIQEFNTHRIKLFESLEEVDLYIEQCGNDESFANTPYYSHHGFINNSKPDDRAYIGYLYFEDGQLKHTNKVIDTVGSTDESLLYNEEDDERKGKLRVNIWEYEDALKLYIDASGSKKHSGLMIDKSKVAPSVRYFDGVYGNGDPADENALFYFDLDNISGDVKETLRLTKIFINDQDVTDPPRPGTEVRDYDFKGNYMRQDLKIGDIIITNFSNEGYRKTSDESDFGLKRYMNYNLTRKQTSIGQVTKAPTIERPDDGYEIHFYTLKPHLDSGLGYDDYGAIGIKPISIPKNANVKELKDFSLALIPNSNVSGLNVTNVNDYNNTKIDHVRFADKISATKRRFKTVLPVGLSNDIFENVPGSSDESGTYILPNFSLCVIPTAQYGRLIHSDGTEASVGNTILQNWPAKNPDITSATISALGVNLQKAIVGSSHIRPGESKPVDSYKAYNLSGLRIDTDTDQIDKNWSNNPNIPDKFENKLIKYSGGLSVNVGRFLEIGHDNDIAEAYNYYEDGKVNVKINEDSGLGEDDNGQLEIRRYVQPDYPNPIYCKTEHEYTETILNDYIFLPATTYICTNKDENGNYVLPGPDDAYGQEVDRIYINYNKGYPEHFIWNPNTNQYENMFVFIYDWDPIIDKNTIPEQYKDFKGEYNKIYVFHHRSRVGDKASQIPRVCTWGKLKIVLYPDIDGDFVVDANDASDIWSIRSNMLRNPNLVKDRYVTPEELARATFYNSTEMPEKETADAALDFYTTLMANSSGNKYQSNVQSWEQFLIDNYPDLPRNEPRTENDTWIERKAETEILRKTSYGLEVPIDTKRGMIGQYSQRAARYPTGGVRSEVRIIDIPKYSIGINIHDLCNAPDFEFKPDPTKMGGLRFNNGGVLAIRINDYHGYNIRQDRLSSNDVLNRGTKGLCIDNNNVLGIQFNKLDILHNDNSGGNALGLTNIGESIENALAPYFFMPIPALTVSSFADLPVVGHKDRMYIVNENGFMRHYIWDIISNKYINMYEDLTGVEPDDTIESINAYFKDDERKFYKHLRQNVIYYIYDETTGNIRIFSFGKRRKLYLPSVDGNITVDARDASYMRTNAPNDVFSASNQTGLKTANELLTYEQEVRVAWQQDALCAIKNQPGSQWRVGDDASTLILKFFADASSTPLDEEKIRDENGNEVDIKNGIDGWRNWVKYSKLFKYDETAFSYENPAEYDIATTADLKNLEFYEITKKDIFDMTGLYDVCHADDINDEPMTIIPGLYVKTATSKTGLDITDGMLGIKLNNTGTFSSNSSHVANGSYGLCINDHNALGVHKSDYLTFDSEGRLTLSTKFWETVVKLQKGETTLEEVIEK